MPENLINGIVNLAGDRVLAEVKRRVETGEDPINILEECRKGMNVVGEQYNNEEIALADLILSGELYKQVFDFLEPFISKMNSVHILDKVVIATMQGDIHDLGKGIFSTLLKAQGFDVYDLGVDVEPKILVEKVKEIRPRFIGLSALITPVLNVMRETVQLLEDQGLRDDVKILIGGGITHPKCKKYIGADYQTIDAIDGLKYCINMSC